MAFKFSKRSRGHLEGVHGDLVAVMELALERSPIDFAVIDGLRTKEEQKVLVAKGKSKTMNSRHLTGHAVDIAPVVNGSISWDWKHYHTLAPIVKQAAADLGVEIEWGGDWKSFLDGPHWQLPWHEYGKTDMGLRHKRDQPEMQEAPAKPTFLQMLSKFLKWWSE